MISAVFRSIMGKIQCWRIDLKELLRKVYISKCDFNVWLISDVEYYQHKLDHPNWSLRSKETKKNLSSTKRRSTAFGINMRNITGIVNYSKGISKTTRKNLSRPSVGWQSDFWFLCAEWKLRRIRNQFCINSRSQ